jgi:hypothetical protein
MQALGGTEHRILPRALICWVCCYIIAITKLLKQCSTDATATVGLLVVVCKDHLGGAYERPKESHITQKQAPQLSQCPARSDGGLPADAACQCAAVVVCKKIFGWRL